MSYDDWKLRSPDDEYPYHDDDDDYGYEFGEEYDDEPEPDYENCIHEDYEADILTGEAMCHRCGHRWIQTAEEIAAEVRRQADYYEAMERYEREREWRERWLWWWDALRDAFSRWRSWLGGLRQPKHSTIDDEIPF